MAVNLTAFSQKWDITPKFAAAVSSLKQVQRLRFPSPAHQHVKMWQII
jgi:hypothetical protein